MLALRRARPIRCAPHARRTLARTHTATAFERALPQPSRLVRAAKIALVVAVPVAALMLLVCNGFDIFIVRDMTAPFLMR